MDQNKDDILVNNILAFSKVFYSLLEYVMKKVDSENSKAGFRILFILRKHGQMPISHLAEKMSIARPNMTMLVDVLTNKGLVERSTSNVDRRIINVALTGEGLKYLDNVTSKMNEVLKEKISVFSDTEKNDVIKSLDSLITFGNRVLND